MWTPVAVASSQRAVETPRRHTRLTRKEADLLDLLRRHAGQVLTREYLLRTVWGYNTATRTRTLDVHIQRLRRKLAPDEACRILTILRSGYCWSVEGGEPNHRLTG